MILAKAAPFGHPRAGELLLSQLDPTPPTTPHAPIWRDAVALWAVVVIALSGCRRPMADARRSPPLPPIGWPSYAGDPGATRFSPITELTPANVRRLRPAWVWRPAEGRVRDTLKRRLASPLSFEATPLVFADTLFLVTPLHQAVALDATTGREIWRFDPGTWRQGATLTRVNVTHRGVTVWSGPQGRRVFLATGPFLYALDAATGKPLPDFGDGGKVDLVVGLGRKVDPAHFGNTSPPAIIDSLVVVGSAVADEVTYPGDPPGDVQAFHAITGAPVWRWSPVPGAGEPGADTWPPNAAATVGHTNTWAPITVDPERGLVFLPVSTPSNDWYGGARLGANLFAESLVCLDGRTGKERWHFQTVHHGLWDYDLASQPTLIQVRRGGRTIDAVAVAGKTGFIYAFDREAGTPLWPIEERPVPPSDVPGEIASHTQPYPTKPAPFARQGFGLSDVVDFTPAIRAQALERLKGRRLGPIFTPPSLPGTIVSPGWIGGAGWGSVAFDPSTRTLYVKATNRATLASLVPAQAGRPDQQGAYVLDPDTLPRSGDHFRLPAVRRWFGANIPPVEIPVGKPPYGTLTAVDMDSGEQRWQITLGDTPAIRKHPALRHLDLPPLGVAGPPGAIVTAGGLLFITGGGSVLFAIDKASGETVWSYELGLDAFSVPVIYRGSDGRPYVVSAAGSGTKARLVAFTLDPP